MSVETRQKRALFSLETLLVSAFFFIPVLSPAFFGWLTGLLAVPVVYLLLSHGMKAGTIQLGACLTLAGLVALAVNRAEVMAFSMTMVPLGYTLAWSAMAEEEPALSGGKGLAVLAASWFLFWSFFAFLTDINPYTQLLQTINTGLEQAGEMYNAPESGLSEETRYQLKLLFDEARQGIPRLLPGMLASLVLITVWLNMTLSNGFAERLSRIKAPWGPYASWQLPEHLVWLPITALVLILFSSGQVQQVGLWLCMLAGAMYCFQGLAVCLTLFHRWNIPKYLRAVLFFMLVVQRYGLVALALLGLSDVWFNFRPHLKNGKQ